MFFRFIQQVYTTTLQLYVSLCTTIFDEHRPNSILSRYVSIMKYCTKACLQHFQSQAEAKGKYVCSLTYIHIM